MSPQLIGIIGIILMFGLLAMRLYIGIAMAVVGFIGLGAIVGFEAGVNILGVTPMAEGSSYTLSVIPLFVLMGQFSFISGISTDIYEATIIDGATRGQYYRHVALPLLMPIVRRACILSLIGSLKYFDLIYVMTGGGPGTATELMATYMYKMSFKHFMMGYGSTSASGMFILVTGIALIIQTLIRGKEEAQ